MSEAENLLNSMDDISVATADPTTEEHIVIDSNRNIYVPESLRRIAVQYDHNIEKVTFDCPRYWDGIDMSGMKVYINYLRSDGELGQYAVEKNIIRDLYICKKIEVPSGDSYDYGYAETDTPFDLDAYNERYDPDNVFQIGLSEVDGYISTPSGYTVYQVTSPEDNTLYVYDKMPEGMMRFTWTISRNVTEAKGQLSFLVCIKATDEDGNEQNHWNTELNRQMTISEGLEVDHWVEDEYPDVITTLLIRMDKTEKYVDENVNNVTWEEIADVTVDTPCARITITEDMNGNPFNLKKAYVVIDYYKNGDINTNLRCSMTNNALVWNDYLISWAQVQSGATHGIRSAIIERICGINKVIGTYIPPNDTTVAETMTVKGDTNTNAKDDSVLMGMIDFKSATTEMNGLTIGSYQESIGAGTRIRLFGVRV